MRRSIEQLRRGWAMLAVAVVAAGGVCGIGCGDSSNSSADAGGAMDRTGPLISHDAWTRTSSDEDPLASHRPDPVECPEDATGREKLDEDLSISVKTAKCNYFSGQQPSIAAIEKGDQLEARVWHFALTGEEGSEAHVAILIDGETAWETTVEIPSEEGELLNPTWTAKSAVPEGATVTFHLHNHGDNKWNFIELVNRGPSE